MGSSSPLVSVVVPAFNAAPFLEESLDSILAQTYHPLDVIVMDDASTDATPGVAARYGAAIRYVRQPRNRGQFGNVNDGIALARGEHIAVFHADDRYEPTILEREVSVLEGDPALRAVFCLDLLVDDDGAVYGRVRLPPDVTPRRPLAFEQVLRALLIHKNRFLRTPSALVRSSVYRSVGLFEETRLGAAADLDMWLRIARSGPIQILDEHLFRYRHTQESQGQQSQRLRLVADTFFEIVDAALNAGWREAMGPAALAAYEAHRAEDRLFVALNHYIRADGPGARRHLLAVRPAALLGSDRVQRGRLTLLYLLLAGLTHLPRIPAVADAFYRRWHVRPWRRGGRA